MHVLFNQIRSNKPRDVVGFPNQNNAGIYQAAKLKFIRDQITEICVWQNTTSQTHSWVNQSPRPQRVSPFQIASYLIAIALPELADL